MNAKHTPGPWHNNAPGYIRAVVSDGGEKNIATALGPYPMTNEEYRANARLIAEAPNMRGLLERFASADPIADNPDEGDACFYCGRARGALHKSACEWHEARALLARIDGPTT